MPSHTDRAFETAIETGLTDSGGYEKRRPSAYDEALALFPDDVSGFLKDSQPGKWAALKALLGQKTAATVLDSPSKEWETKGALYILRHGFKCYGQTFRMAWFRPNTAVMSSENLPLVGKILGHKRHRTTAGYAHLAASTRGAAAARGGPLVEAAMKLDRAPPSRAGVCPEQADWL